VSSAAKAEVARAASGAIDYRRRTCWRVRELTGGRGADLVLDSVAGAHMARSFQMLSRRNGGAVRARRQGPPPQAILGPSSPRDGTGLRTCFLGTTLATELARIPDAYAALFDRPAPRDRLPIERVPLAATADAHARIEGQQAVGKVILCRDGSVRPQLGAAPRSFVGAVMRHASASRMRALVQSTLPRRCRSSLGPDVGGGRSAADRRRSGSPRRAAPCPGDAAVAVVSLVNKQNIFSTRRWARPGPPSP
jgi:hypothetical protein